MKKFKIKYSDATGTVTTTVEAGHSIGVEKNTGDLVVYGERANYNQRIIALYRNWHSAVEVDEESAPKN